VNRKLIVALDLPTLEEARRLVKLLKEEVSLYKVGSVLFTKAGPEAVAMIRDEGGEVFLDLKFHDIPNTVASACEAASKIDGVFMLNVHASGGKAMLEAASAAVKKTKSKPILLGVTVLTSEASAEASSEVLRLAMLCKESGLGGVVCSAQEAAAVRKACGKDFVIVTPGIRPTGSAAHDQIRITTPTEAVQNGADYIVVGRPILEASDPLKVVRSILKEIA
jgi:orotidine-5'-phosphate decarboxylase